MKFKLTVNGHNILLDAGQLETLTNTLSYAEHLTESHVGNNLGSQGYNNAYVPVVYKPNLKSTLMCLPVDDDLVDTIKLTMKLNDIKPRT